jgi:hypothetical protein
LPLSVNTNRDINASIEIWRFFSKYRLDDLLQTDEHALLSKITIYPNPTAGTVHFDFQENPDELSITDIAGREVDYFGRNNIPSVYSFKEKGVFFISIIRNNELKTERIIVE